MPTNQELAHRWMASKHWGGLWRRGMPLVIYKLGQRIEATVVKGEADCIEGEQPWCVEPGITGFKWPPDDGSGWIPDIDLSTARAFLLEDVRKAWGKNAGLTIFEACHMGGPTVRVCLLNTETMQNDYFSFGDGDEDEGALADTMAEALLMALEAAP